MKVLLTADTVGGVWTFALALTRALARNDVEVTLATMGRALDADQRDEVRRCGAAAVYVSDFALEWMQEPWADLERAGDWLLRLAAEVEPDVVHLSSYGHAALPWRAPVLVTGHSCVLSWFEAVRREPAPPSWERYRQLVERGLQAADVVTAPTAAMLRALERHYRFEGARTVVPNGRSANGFAAHPKEPFVFAAGRLWDEAKNITSLDGVASSLRWPVRVAGEISSPDGTRPWPRHLELLGRLAPRRLAEAYARASIFAAPERYEPFGLAPLEAALSGCALVLGDIPSLHEVWGGAALYVDPDSRDALRTALACLIEEPAVRRDLAAAALRRARAFTPERTAAAYLALYERLLEAPAAGLEAA